LGLGWADGVRAEGRPQVKRAPVAHQHRCPLPHPHRPHGPRARRGVQPGRHPPRHRRQRRDGPAVGARTAGRRPWAYLRFLPPASARASSPP